MVNKVQQWLVVIVMAGKSHTHLRSYVDIDGHKCEIVDNGLERVISCRLMWGNMDMAHRNKMIVAQLLDN